MMIGGKDVVLTNPHEPEFALQEVFRRALQVWPQATVEDADTGLLLNLVQDTPFAGLREIMIYKDQRARDKWERLGAISTNLNTMIHVIVDWDCLTLVFDNDHNEDSQTIIKAVKRLVYPVDAELAV